MLLDCVTESRCADVTSNGLLRPSTLQPLQQMKDLLLCDFLTGSLPIRWPRGQHAHPHRNQELGMRRPKCSRGLRQHHDEAPIREEVVEEVCSRDTIVTWDIGSPHQCLLQPLLQVIGSRHESERQRIGRESWTCQHDCYLTLMSQAEGQIGTVFMPVRIRF